VFGSDLLYIALNIPSITDNLDDFETGKALFSDLHLPEKFEGVNSINFYMASPFIPDAGYDDYLYSTNCRGRSYDDSRGLAQTVIEEVNRTSHTTYYIVGEVQTTIPPMDDTDVYNTVINFTIKSR